MLEDCQYWSRSHYVGEWPLGAREVQREVVGVSVGVLVELTVGVSGPIEPQIVYFSKQATAARRSALSLKRMRMTPEVARVRRGTSARAILIT